MARAKEQVYCASDVSENTTGRPTLTTPGEGSE